MIERPDAMQRVRLAHTEALLAQLRSAGPLSRAELIRLTGLSRTTLFDIIGDLIARGVVVEREPALSGHRGRGRPSTTVSLNPSAGRIIGIDLGRATITVIVATLSHDILARGSRAVTLTAGPIRRANAAIKLIDDLVHEHDIDLRALEAIGLGLPGLVASRGGPAGGSPSVAAKQVGARIQDRYGVAVVTDNNSRLAALAEGTWGATRDVRDAIYVRWSDGVGGGLIVDGRLARGAHGAAGEIGHVSVEPDGDPCPCGGRGCLELLIRPSALIERCARRGVTVADPSDLVTRARAGEPAVEGVVRHAATLLGRVLSGMVVQLDPGKVAIGGTLARAGETVLEPVRAAIGQLAIPRHPRPLDVVTAQFGDEGGALGAVAAALRLNVSEPLPVLPTA
ncbi:ROK family protein [Micromonospora peucetia]|uniref:ROK family protein n=2 Tax=Micromonospora peucetia TaxID=47871 RepID=A0ABZ1E901_9ACTN|nr:ROK family protein [Micromonospora peucetia]MCX4388027.1 ROK family protein [Micromonospora peucetia]WSA31283.1 ROK family protein [Micromonospora peucetia]